LTSDQERDNSLADYRYDVAISFAGEQRSEAEQLARCLQSNQVSVFYDEFEGPELWGKDLFEHLSSVYSEQARYCIIFASRHYAEKVWTTHERKFAQERALTEKGNEYILPVRFDDTAIPGVPSTMGYLDFQKYGTEGICNAFVHKLRGPQSGTTKIAPSLSTSSSGLAAILITEKNLLLFLPVLHGSFANEKASLVVMPDEADDENHLNGLKRAQYPVLVAFKHDVCVCKIEDVISRTGGGVGQFELSLKVLQTRFTPHTEVGLSSMNKDRLAEARTRRLLLNENPAKKNPNMNEAFKEVLLRGQDTITHVSESPFPELFKKYRSAPKRFLEIAWIDAMLVLKTSACVADVEKLALILSGVQLRVDFSGRRGKEYRNADPYRIEVAGNLTLE
jgi:hypothetical protein